MGLFDIFKQKKQQSMMDKIAPSMQQILSILFPKGEEDHKRQINVLYEHFLGRYERTEIDNNLIFTLYGFLITGETKSLDSALVKLLNRSRNIMTRDDAEYLCSFAISNHPKLAILKAVSEYEKQSSQDGCDTDIIPNAKGEFGYCNDNPIPTKGITGIYDYLSRLRDFNDNEIRYERLGSGFSSVSEHPIDIYKIFNSNGTIKTLYFSGYHQVTSKKAPANFKLYDSSGYLLDNGLVETEVNKEPRIIINGYEVRNVRTIADQAKSWNASKVYPVISNKDGVARTYNDGTPKMFLTDGTKEHLVAITKPICKKIIAKEQLPQVLIADCIDPATGTSVPTLFEASLIEQSQL